MNLEWALAKSPDFVGDYINALKAGQDLGRQAARPGPDVAGQIATLDAAARASAARRAELLGALGTGLLQAPYAGRAAILAHLTPALAAQGIDPAAISAFDPTDANLGAHIATATALARDLAAAPQAAADDPQGPPVSADLFAPT